LARVSSNCRLFGHAAGLVARKVIEGGEMLACPLVQPGPT
jgi:hypothetical protein